ncbi:MAG: AmmeMemoRadiSam system protein B, partial [Acidobacteria bacterium]
MSMVTGMGAFCMSPSPFSRRSRTGRDLPLGLAACCLAAALVGADGTARQTDQAVREPAMAGQFYPAEPRALVAALDAYFKDATPASGQRPLALVAPHAGYVFSGQIAADAWNQAAGHGYQTIVLLGTNHSGL